MKKDERKPKPSLFYTSALYETVRVRAFGIDKHGSEEGWKTTTPIEHIDSAVRHLLAAKDGEQLDAESGFLHLAHAICNCMFEIERIANGVPSSDSSKKMPRLQETGESGIGK